MLRRMKAWTRGITGCSVIGMESIGKQKTLTLVFLSNGILSRAAVAHWRGWRHCTTCVIAFGAEGGIGELVCFGFL